MSASRHSSSVRSEQQHQVHKNRSSKSDSPPDVASNNDARDKMFERSNSTFILADDDDYLEDREYFVVDA